MRTKVIVTAIACVVLLAAALSAQSLKPSSSPSTAERSFTIEVEGKPKMKIGAEELAKLPRVTVKGCRPRPGCDV